MVWIRDELIPVVNDLPMDQKERDAVINEMVTVYMQSPRAATGSAKASDQGSTLRVALAEDGTGRVEIEGEEIIVSNIGALAKQLGTDHRTVELALSTAKLTSLPNVQGVEESNKDPVDVYPAEYSAVIRSLVLVNNKVTLPRRAKNDSTGPSEAISFIGLKAGPTNNERFGTVAEIMNFRQRDGHKVRPETPIQKQAIALNQLNVTVVRSDRQQDTHWCIDNETKQPIVIMTEASGKKDGGYVIAFTGYEEDRQRLYWVD
jgi:hypothetical protein